MNMTSGELITRLLEYPDSTVGFFTVGQEAIPASGIHLIVTTERKTPDNKPLVVSLMRIKGTPHKGKAIAFTQV